MKIVKGINYDCTPDKRGLGAFLFDASDNFSDCIAQVCSRTEKTETFGNMKIRSIRVALQMSRRGVKKNDIIALCSQNSMDSSIPFLAAQYLGAAIASLDPTLSIIDTTHLLNLTKPRMIFVSENAVKLIESSVTNLSPKPDIVVYGHTDKYLKFSDFEKSHPEESRFKPVVIENSNDTAIVFFSSGTTGLPKGICVSHFGIMYTSETFLGIGIDPTSIIHYSSLYWISAVMFLILAYVTGSKRIVCPEFDGNIMAKIIEVHKATFIFMAPGYTYKLNENNTNYDTSSLKTLILGGCPISKEQLLRTRKLFPHTKVFLGYGMTEVSGFISTFHTERDAKLIDEKPLSSGKPVPELSIMIVDPDTEEVLGANQQGEIRIYTKALTTGYYNQSSEGILDSHGYLKSGDIGYYDEDGAIYVVDRIKEMFKYQSWHIVPATLEAIIMEHPAVSDVAVFGIPHEEDGDHPAAAIVVEKSALGTITPNDIQQFVAKQVTERQWLRGGVYFIDKINKTPSGKIKRREIKNYILNNKLQ